MKVAMGALLVILTAVPCLAQKNDAASAGSNPAQETNGEAYTVAGATREQEAILREQIRLMHPKILPARVIFVPHWKYLDDARIFQLHVPTGFSSVMFTHLPSRTVFVDGDRYLGQEWLGHWIAHELGHLESNSAKEEDAERVAHRLRAALKSGYKKS